MSTLKRLEINCDPPIKLNADGYAELVSQIDERLLESDEGAYQATAIVLEVEPSDGEPQPLTGEIEAVEGTGKDEEEGSD